MIARTCTRIDLADLLDLSEQRIGTLTKTGVLTRGPKGYEVRTAVQAYLHFLRSKTGTLTAERSRLTKAQADLAELTLRHRTGELVLRDAVNRVVFTMNRRVRDNFLNLPSRCDALVAAESDRQRCFDLLNKEVLQILTTLCDEPHTPDG